MHRIAITRTHAFAKRAFRLCPPVLRFDAATAASPSRQLGNCGGRDRGIDPQRLV
jgi:hypothetical protein